MAAGQLGCRVISIAITRKAQQGQKVRGRPLLICQAETPETTKYLGHMCDIYLFYANGIT